MRKARPCVVPRLPKALPPFPMETVIRPDVQGNVRKIKIFAESLGVDQTMRIGHRTAVSCSYCKNKGWFGTVRCPECDGDGWIYHWPAVPDPTPKQLSDARSALKSERVSGLNFEGYSEQVLADGQIQTEPRLTSELNQYELPF